jgi:hypothetical protein
VNPSNRSYRAIISSDWNQCLAPCGPFDVISFSYPELTAKLQSIFKRYTGNEITLGEATQKLSRRLPGAVTEAMMDRYLERQFSTYRGVAELIRWCDRRGIFFMINTTGMIGYFQRVFAKGLLPTVPALSAHPMIRYAGGATDPPHLLDLHETWDKSRNTEKIRHQLNIGPDRVILIGDSGGDGPHFEWGSRHAAVLIGSMTKASLDSYCRDQGIGIDYHFGPIYEPGHDRDPMVEMQVDFMDLRRIIEECLMR